MIVQLQCFHQVTKSIEAGSSLRIQIYAQPKIFPIQTLYNEYIETNILELSKKKIFLLKINGTSKLKWNDEIKMDL
jgi:hypothetical protein